MCAETSRGQEKVCPNSTCAFDKHPPGANFCMLCGTLLYSRCDNCIENNPMYAKYCYLCGSNLEDLRLDQLEEQKEAAESPKIEFPEPPQSETSSETTQSEEEEKP